MSVKIQLKRSTAAAWTAANPTLSSGEIGYETDTAKFKIGNGSTAWTSLGYSNANLGSASLDALSDVTITSAANGDFLRWNGTSWINDAVNLSTDTVGSYVESLVAGTGVTLSNNSGEASTPTVAIGQDVSASTSPTFAGLHLNGSITFEGATANEFETTLSVTDPTADRIITFPDATTTVVGTDTTQTLSNKTLTTPTINGPEITATGGTPRIHGIYLPEPHFITFEGATTNEFETVLTVVDPTADRTVSLPDASGTVALSGTIALGTDTTGNYMSDLTQGTGVTITHTPGEGSNATIAIGQAVGTSASVQFASVTAPLIGNASTATVLQTARNIAGQSFDGSTNISIAPTDLTGVTSTAAELNILDGATLSTTELNYVDGVTSAIQTQIDSKAPIASPTFTGTVTLAADPSSALQAATKQYVDNVASNINFHASVVAATTGNLAGIYNNGTAGVGATLTKATNGSIGTIDGASVVVGNRILIKSQTDSKENGIYTITAVGSVSAPWVVTRATDADNSVSGEMASGDFCFVMSGSTNAGYGFINNSPTNPIVLGTDNVIYTEFNAAQTITAGTGLDLASNVMSLNATLDDLSNVTASAPSDGQFLKYASASSAWVAASVPTINALDDIGNVSASAPVDYSPLVWSSSASAWIANSQDLILGVPGTTDYLTINATSGISMSSASEGTLQISVDQFSGSNPDNGPYFLLNANNLTFSNGSDSFMIDPYWATSGQVLAFTPGSGSGGTWGPSNVVRDNLVRLYMEVM